VTTASSDRPAPRPGPRSVPWPVIVLAGPILARLALPARWLGADSGVLDTASDHFPALANPRPCGVLDDGTGIYLSTGPVDVPYEQRHFLCPRR
jgi:hypothetical protein